MMKIKVTYSELVSDSHYNNKRAEATVELEVADVSMEEAYAEAWRVVKEQVRQQLEPLVKPQSRLRDLELVDRNLPF